MQGSAKRDVRSVADLDSTFSYFLENGLTTEVMVVYHLARISELLTTRISDKPFLS